MKRKITVMLLSAAMLAGCAGSISEPAREESQPQAKEKLTAGPAEVVNELTMLTDNASSTTGVYLAEDDPHGFTHTLYYADANTAVMQPLCPLENCSHDNSECPAWFKERQNVYLAASGETLYAIGAEYSNRFRTEIQQSDTFNLTIWAYSMDGETRTQVFSQNIELPLEEDGDKYPMPVNDMYYDGTYFYAWVVNTFETSNAGRFIKIDPQSGTYEEMPSPVDATQKYDPDFAYAYSEGMVKGFLVLSGYSRKTDYVKTYAVSMDGSEIYQIPEDGKYIQDTMSAKESIFRLIPQEDGTAQILCYTPGAQSPEVWADLSGLSGKDEYGSYSYRLAVDCLGNPFITDYSAEPAQNYLCLPGGKVVLCALQTTYPGRDEDLSCLITTAPAGDQLLVFLRTEIYSAFSMDQNGSIVRDNIYTKQYALISREDYENQTPNYRLVNQ